MVNSGDRRIMTRMGPCSALSMIGLTGIRRGCTTGAGACAVVGDRNTLGGYQVLRGASHPLRTRVQRRSH
jgi:hypothetical protein